MKTGMLSKWSVGLLLVLGSAGFGACPLAAGMAESGAFVRRPEGHIIFRGSEAAAYRDPAAVFHGGCCYLFFTLVENVPGGPYSYIAWSRSANLLEWSTPVKVTARDKRLNFCAPGNVVREGGKWVMCVTSYPRPNGEKYANEDARIWTMRSSDLMAWSAPELLRVKGSEVPQGAMGRMIDPYLVQTPQGLWWCFFKQKGISYSISPNLRDWNFGGSFAGGENPCVVHDGREYVLYHSPSNGVGVKRSGDLRGWRDEGLLTLGQTNWPWAQGRLTAGFVLDLRANPEVGKAILFFHGSDYPEEDRRGGFDNFASIGFVWSSDLKEWMW